MKKLFVKRIFLLTTMLAFSVCNFIQVAFAEEFGDYVVSVYNEESGLPTGEANDIL